MRWKFLSPNKKKEKYDQELRDGMDSRGNFLDEAAIARRQGYINAVNDSNAIYASNHATPEQRAAYKARKKRRK